jgi:hypothetical protein
MARLLTDAAYAAKMWSVFQMEQWIGCLNLIRVAAALMAVLNYIQVKAGISQRSEGNPRFRNLPAGERRFEEGKNGRSCNQGSKT